MFANTKFDKQEIGGKLKNPIAFKIWGRERVKVEKSVGNCPKMHYFHILPSNSYNRGKFLVEKYVIKGPLNHLGTICTYFLRKPWKNKIFLLFIPNFPPVPP